MDATSQTLIRAVEVWIPGGDQLLELRSGSYGPARAFAARSRSLCFGRGEGLPGQAWEEGHPLLLPEFDHRNFRRTDAAHAAGLTCAVAVPFFGHGALQAVLVMFCGRMTEHASAMELWRDDIAPTADIRLVDGAYGTAAPEFETISRKTSFARGAGLPGIALEKGTAPFLENLGKAAESFVRGKAAGAAGLVRGLAIPLPTMGGARHVVTFLASAGLPLAQRVERWVAGSDPQRLHRAYAFSELHGGSSLIEASLELPRREASQHGAMATALEKSTRLANRAPQPLRQPPSGRPRCSSFRSSETTA